MRIAKSASRQCPNRDRLRHFRPAGVASAILLLLLGTIALQGCAKDSGKKAELAGLSSADDTRTASADATGSSDSTLTKQASPTEASSKNGKGEAQGASDQDSGNSQSSGGSGATGGSSSSGGGSASGGSTKPEAASMRVRVIFWNETQKRPATGFAIKLGNVTWSPDSNEKKQTRTFGPLPIDETLVLGLYPQGTKAARLVAELKLYRDMLPDSEQDAIHVDVRDDKIRVLGTPVENFEREFDRP